MACTILLLQMICFLAAIIAAVSIIQRLCILINYRRMARENGCEPIKYTANDNLTMGFLTILQQLRAVKNHRVLEESKKKFEKFGNTFQTRQLVQTTIMTIEPLNIKTVLAVRFDDYGIGHRFRVFSPLLGVGIFDTSGKLWHDSRSLIRPNFSRDQIADLSAFEDLIPGLFALIPRDGKTVIDLQDIFFRYTIDSATHFLFGESVRSLESATGTDTTFAEAFNYAQYAIRMRIILGSAQIFLRDAKAKKCNKFCRDFARQFVDKAVDAVQSNQTVNKYVFSHELARHTNDKVRILDELMNVLLAGRDTTASLLSNMFFMLAKNPAIWAKLQAEVATLDGRLPSYQELRNLKYLKCCINESLRIHPVVPTNSREAIKDTCLPLGGGPDGKSPVFVPKGTRVAYNLYSLHRRRDLYGDDADDFRPERWENEHLKPQWEYLPFNGGPRICIGQQYALAEVSYVTVRIAQEFSSLVSHDPGPWEENLTLTLCSRNGTNVCLKPAV